LQKKEQQKADSADSAAGGKKKKVTAAQLRVQKGTLQSDVWRHRRKTGSSSM
jgi:hypothetical protein